MNEFLADPLAIAVGLLGLLMSILSWLGRQQVRRLDEIEKHHVARDTLEKTMADMRAERRELHGENRQMLDRIDANVNTLRESLVAPVAVLTQRVGTLEERVEELRDFKHQLVDPAVRYVDFLKTEKPWERK